MAEFIGIKSWKAKGKRLTNYFVENIREIDPVIRDEHDSAITDEDVEKQDNGSDDIPFEIRRPSDDDANQMTLF